MQGIEVLYWGLSVLFCLAMVFAILLWCRSWRKEERETTARQLQILAREVGRLSEALEMLDHISASLQTADEQLTKQVEDLQVAIRRLQSPHAKPASAPLDPPSEPNVEDRYAEAQGLLQAGNSPVEVARKLDLGTAEVHMIARMLEEKK
ncbi:MAG: hypothetical protein O7G87_02640, partial [bacterium]|nr:hypothetical protein [bacterium]